MINNKSQLSIFAEPNFIMAEPEANIFELIYQISPTVKERDGQTQKKYEDPAITECLYLIKEQPDIAKQKTRHGWATLHLACFKGSPFEVVAALLKAWPEATKQKDSSGKTPLHLA
eukprot:10605480-Ditylum_brightwellii.AAC.1